MTTFSNEYKWNHFSKEIHAMEMNNVNMVLGDISSDTTAENYTKTAM